MCQVKIPEEKKETLNERVKKATKKDKGHTQTLKML